MVRHERRLVAALEDEGTAAAVAREAARVALAQGADTVIVVHVLDAHTMVSGLYWMNGVPGPLGETEDEGAALGARTTEGRPCGHVVGCAPCPVAPEPRSVITARTCA